MFRRVARVEAADLGSIARRLATSESTTRPALAGRLDLAHTKIYEKVEADIAHRRAGAGLQET
jgi:hypothetical protein